MIIGLLIGFYLFVGPFFLVSTNENRVFLDWVTGGPTWLGSFWVAINHSFFIIQSKFEIYGGYIAWVVEFAGT